MSDEKLLVQSNLAKSNLDTDFRDLFAMNFTTLNISENYSQIYKQDPSSAIPKRLIELYVKHIKPDYNEMIFNFKKKYVTNESLVEKNDTKEQRQGLRLVYDYIQNYDVNKPINIFIATMQISGLLWKPTDEKNNEGLAKEQEELAKQAIRLKEEAKKEKNLNKMHEAMQIEKSLRDRTHKTKIGSTIRSNNSEDNVNMYAAGFDVPSAKEALEYMNSYLLPEKQQEFAAALENPNIIAYISYCVKEMCNMIYYQPFMDGNKRTARAVLNLLFKARGLPPVYIKAREREEYKKALFKAMKDKDYKDIIGFYLFKICDSIYELDIVPYKKDRLDDFYNEKDNELVDGIKK